MDWLEKVKQAWQTKDEFLDTGADYFRIFAKAVRKVADAAEEAADSFDPTPGGQPTALGAVNAQDVEALIKEIQEEANKPQVAAEGKYWQQLLASLLLDFLQRIIDKKKQ